jgi:hypothetical protein
MIGPAYAGSIFIHLKLFWIFYPIYLFNPIPLYPPSPLKGEGGRFLVKRGLRPLLNSHLFISLFQTKGESNFKKEELRLS